MRISHEEAKRLSYWEYTALLARWNRRRKAEAADTDEDAAQKAPTAEREARAFSKIPAAAFGRPN